MIFCSWAFNGGQGCNDFSTSSSRRRLQQLVLLDICPFAYSENRLIKFLPLCLLCKKHKLKHLSGDGNNGEHLKKNGCYFPNRVFSKGQWLFNLNVFTWTLCRNFVMAGRCIVILILYLLLVVIRLILRNERYAAIQTSSVQRLEACLCFWADCNAEKTEEVLCVLVLD